MRKTHVRIWTAALALLVAPSLAHADGGSTRPFKALFGPTSMATTGPVAPTTEVTLALVQDAAAVQVAQAEVHPEPAHTGFGALAKDTLGDFKAFPRRRSTWVILGIGAAAAGLVHPEDPEINSHLVGSKAVGRLWAPGKWIGSAPVQIGASLGLYVIGRYVVPAAEGEPRTNKLSHLGFDLLRAQILSQTFVQAIKHTVRRDRPTGECCSFPSGHAATAFAAAAVLERHFGYRAAWPTLAIASYVATSRLHDNRHFASDVLFGSAIGMATGWTIVGRHGRSQYALLPVPMRGGVALSISKVDRS